MDASGGHAAEPAEDEGAKEAPAAAAADSDDEDFKPSFKPEAKGTTLSPTYSRGLSARVSLHLRYSCYPCPILCRRPHSYTGFAGRLLYRSRQ